MMDFERTTEQVDVLNATPFVAFLVEGAVRPPKRSLTLVVKATFALPGGEVVEEQRPPDGDVRLGEDDDLEAPIVYASDFAPFKLRADVTLSGHLWR